MSSDSHVIDWESLLEVEQSLCQTSLMVHLSSELDGPANGTLLMYEHLERVSPFIRSSLEDQFTMADLEKLLEVIHSPNADPRDTSAVCSDLEKQFWLVFVTNFSNSINTMPNYTKFMIYSIGIPTQQLRARIWGILTGGCDSFGRLNDVTFLKLYESIYYTAPHALSSSLTCTDFERSPSYKQILLDVNRTFPKVPFFQSEANQVKLLRILNAYSLYDLELGYCQGLAFLVGVLMYVLSHRDYTSETAMCDLENERILFVSLCKVMEINKSLRSIFDPQMSGINEWFTQFTEIARRALPQDLLAHLEVMEVDFKLFLSQWFLSFFGITCEFELLIKVVDLMILEGFKTTIFRVSTVLLLRNREILLGFFNQEQIYKFLLSKDIFTEYESDHMLLMHDLNALSASYFTSDALDEFSKPRAEVELKSRSVSPKRTSHTVAHSPISTNPVPSLLNSFSNTMKSTFKSFSQDAINQPQTSPKSTLRAVFGDVKAPYYAHTSQPDFSARSIYSISETESIGSDPDQELEGKSIVYGRKAERRGNLSIASLPDSSHFEEILRSMNSKLNQLEFRVSELERENMNSKVLLHKMMETFGTAKTENPVSETCGVDLPREEEPGLDTSAQLDCSSVYEDEDYPPVTPTANDGRSLLTVEKEAVLDEVRRYLEIAEV
ncbi:hypothetical protein BABINDRAFT_160814 [Babjeviella inositovora NRRL Y-12698]|uniref:Rab-GAP TBC domain-containing protein n=1 Tax=Babjeviella inositovora NRRL Y-12698 TaxID=984486 RepID=A0A1E3QSQ8_9ASCO|nr:uncharacterized protein BABINDRAFT_160814 [Babjeviella inositovora NRRL Y-12698]ODQ80544.1 hypothetical protein BABINDRAFT_160814 [Babjeviella inositovora NRRL Y-12698]